MTKHKISIILSICFASITLLSLIVFSILQTNTGLNLPSPDTIKIYKLSTSASSTYSKGSSDYNKILSLYSNMFEKTYLAQLADQDILTGEIYEDPTKAEWIDANYETGVFVEFVYNDAKKLIIERDGNTRRVDITSIILQLTRNNSVEQVSVYYKTKSDSSSSSSSNKQTEKE